MTVILYLLNTSNVGFTPDKSLEAFGPRDLSGVKPPFSVFNLYLYNVTYAVCYLHIKQIPISQERRAIWKNYGWSFFIISRVLSNKTNLIFISCIHFETTLTEDPAFTATASMFVINYIGTCSTAVRAITNTLKSCSSPAGMLFCSLFSTHMQGIWH